MQNIYGNALANFNTDKIEWCHEYMRIMRGLIFEKYDHVTAHILEYVEDYIRYTKEELANKANLPQKK